MCSDGSTNVNILSELINISLFGVKSDIHVSTLPSIIVHGLINLQSGCPMSAKTSSISDIKIILFVKIST